MTNAGVRRSSWLGIAFDLIIVVVLAIVCPLCWCISNGKWDGSTWTLKDWSLPATYSNDPELGDFFPTAAFLKASSNWNGLPFRWKTVPELGAPDGANWNDFPSLDETVLTFQVILTRLFGLFPGMNASFAIAHALAGIACYTAARLSRANRTWSAVAGLAFGVSPFIFAQLPHHFQVAYVWPVAFFPLAWRAVSTPPGLAWGKRPFWFSVGFGLVAGLHFVYYTNVFCQLVLLGAAIEWYRTRNTATLLAALAVIVAAAVGFAINSVDEWTYRLFHDPNPRAFVRQYFWLEIYGLKLVDLVIPPVTHHSEALAVFARSHRSGDPENGIPPLYLLDEGASYLGVVSLLALAWLVVDAVRSGLRRRFDEVPIEAWWILWIVLMFTTGGLNAILGAAGITMFRTACRYSVVIQAICLLYAARRLTSVQAMAVSRFPRGTEGLLTGAVASALGIFILWDQVPRVRPQADPDRVASLVESDRAFVAEMEEMLPEGAMVLQLPAMEYPESPIPMPNFGVYEHFRPFLYSTQLRFSYGTQKGRDQEKWLKTLIEMEKKRQGFSLEQWLQEIAKVVREADERGFAAVYINRGGYPSELADMIERMIREMGYTRRLIRSDMRDLDCIPLKPVATNTP